METSQIVSVSICDMASSSKPTLGAKKPTVPPTSVKEKCRLFSYFYNRTHVANFAILQTEIMFLCSVAFYQGQVKVCSNKCAQSYSAKETFFSICQCFKPVMYVITRLSAHLLLLRNSTAVSALGRQSFGGLAFSMKFTKRSPNKNCHDSITMNEDELFSLSTKILSLLALFYKVILQN